MELEDRSDEYWSIIDLTQFGVQVSAEAWYLGLVTAFEDQLVLQTDVLAWWREHSHIGIAQRMTKFFQEVLLAEVAAPIVVFVDEIDTTLSLDFTDDFYAAIRYLYNARANVPQLHRLSFVLIGVATPGDLIRDSRRTWFNIGQRVDLADWTLEEVLPLSGGLGLSPDTAWFAIHPYSNACCTKNSHPSQNCTASPSCLSIARYARIELTPTVQ